MKTALIFIIPALFLLGCVENSTNFGSPKSTINPLTTLCEKENSPSKMNLQEALDIFKKSECAAIGTLSTENAPFCNAATGTWWINLDAKKPEKSCNLACVVNVETGYSQVNWQCASRVSQ